MNVTVVNARAEEYQMKNAFDTMIARAVASIDKLVAISKILLCDDGVLIMMKSDETPNKQYSLEIHPLSVPGIAANRTLLIMRNKA